MSTESYFCVADEREHLIQEIYDALCGFSSALEG